MHTDIHGDFASTCKDTSMRIQGLLRRTVYHVMGDAKLPLICSPNLYSTCGNVDTVHTYILAMTVSSRPQASWLAAMVIKRELP